MDHIRQLFRFSGVLCRWESRDKTVTGRAVICPMDRGDRRTGKIYDEAEGVAGVQLYLFYGDRTFSGMRRGDTVREKNAEYDVVWTEENSSPMGWYLRVGIRKKEGGDERVV